MNGSVCEIRNELLARHAELRAAVSEVRVAVHQVRDGSVESCELERALINLGETLRAHCLHEDELLADLIPKVDAWGDARAELLSNAHAWERRELDDALLQTRESDDIERVLAITVGCIERLLEQFAREERFGLAAAVRSDDIMPRNSFCG